MPVNIDEYVLIYHAPTRGVMVASYDTEEHLVEGRRRVATTYGRVLKVMTRKAFCEALGIEDVTHPEPKG